MSRWCMRHLEGKTFELLTVIRLAGSNRKRERLWECLCKCGVVCTYSTDHLTRKKRPVKSCGCIRFYKGNQHKDWKGEGEISGGWWRTHVLRERTQTNRPRVDVDITIESAWQLFLKQDKKCALSGIPLQFSNKGAENTASLDRIDSSLGYTLTNVQWVHKHINFMKRTYSQEYFINMCKKIAAFNIDN